MTGDGGSARAGVECDCLQNDEDFRKYDQGACGKLKVSGRTEGSGMWWGEREKSGVTVMGRLVVTEMSGDVTEEGVQV